MPFFFQECNLMDKDLFGLLGCHDRFWAMEESAFSVFLQSLPMLAANPQIKRVNSASNPPGGIAVLPIHGVISNRAYWWAGAPLEMLSQALEDFVNSSSVQTIVLDVDSPGGTVPGVIEFADQIREARKKKKIIAVANTDAASAAYWLASAADELVVAPSGSVGSIGVFMVHHDYSEALKSDGVATTIIKAGRFKAEGNPYQPLTNEAQQAFQSDIDSYYAKFLQAVALGRGVNASKVQNGFGEGRMVQAEKAVAAGMADRVATLSEVLKSLTGGGLRSSSSASNFAAWEQRQRLIDMF
jgi:capsid assembly protease